MQHQVAETLNTTGVYSQCRNPLYLANCMIYLGLAVFCQSLVLAVVMGLALALYCERIIMAEETFLENRFGNTYSRWAAEVPAFFPRFRSWAAPAVPFSVLLTLRGEYPGWLATVLLLTAIELGQELAEGEALGEDFIFWALAASAITACLTLAVLKRNTTLLSVAGR